MIVSFFIGASMFVSGCGKSQPPAAPLASSAEVQAEVPLPELEQNKIEPFNVTIPKDPSEVQVFENRDDDHQKISEEESSFSHPQPIEPRMRSVLLEISRTVLSAS
jgi:hypothetical protein